MHRLVYVIVVPMHQRQVFSWQCQTLSGYRVEPHEKKFRKMVWVIICTEQLVWKIRNLRYVRSNWVDYNLKRKFTKRMHNWDSSWEFGVNCTFEQREHTSDASIQSHQFLNRSHTESSYIYMGICLRDEPRQYISNNVVCATSKGSDQPAHTRSLIRAFVGRLNRLWLWSYWPNIIMELLSFKRKLHSFAWVYTCQNATLLEIAVTVGGVLHKEIFSITRVKFGIMH